MLVADPALNDLYGHSCFDESLGNRIPKAIAVSATASQAVLPAPRRHAAARAFDGLALSDLASGVQPYHDRLRAVLPVLNLAEVAPESTLAQRNQ